MTDLTKQQVLKLLTEKEKRINANYLQYALPDESIRLMTGETIWARFLYPKHLSFLAAGSSFVERALFGGNRVAKSRTGALEVAMHATGLYPEWWQGKKFKKPPNIWVGGDRGESIRDSIQPLLLKMLGHTYEDTGYILKKSAMMGVSNGISQYDIKHVNGVSKITVKTYQAGRTAWEGADIDFIWLDEECPYDIYIECMMRITSSKGSLMLTFTPDSGLSETALHFLKQEGSERNDKFHVTVGWDDVPHLDQKTKEHMMANMPPHMIDCRTKGVPYLGSGAVYPVPAEVYVVAPFEISTWNPRSFALDVGWNATAAVWGFIDKDTGISYIYSDYQMGQKEPFVHAHNIQTRGKWIPGVIDPASAGSNQKDGTSLWQSYQAEGLDLVPADNALETGIFDVYQQLTTGKLKIFSTCVGLLEDLKVYRRDEKGDLARNQNDHRPDALRYWVRTGKQIAITEPNEDDIKLNANFKFVGRSPTTGY